MIKSNITQLYARKMELFTTPQEYEAYIENKFKTGISTRITIVNDFWRVSFRYCGSIVYPNGLIYLFHENGRVIKLSPTTDELCFIGKILSTICFDAKVGLDGNIYGYSDYQKGIMKINVANELIEMIHSEIYPGAFGTKY